jgi:excisionase family DNA binding protein
MNDNVLLSTKEAAIRLGLSQDHIRRLLENGEIKGQKIGNSWVVFDLSYVRRRKPKYGKKGK